MDAIRTTHSYPPHAQLPRLDLSHPPVQTYYYVTYAPDQGFRIHAYTVVWDVPGIWDAILTQLARVAALPTFSCWLDSMAGDTFLREHNWEHVLVDGVFPNQLSLSSF